MQALFSSKPVSLVKPHKVDKEVQMYILDDQHLDYISGKLNNKDILRIVGKALSMGYKSFTLGIADGYDIVAEMYPSGQITVNWDIVRVVGRSEWSA